MLGPNRRPCSHQCNNKNTCAHDCCKNGVVVRATNPRTSMMENLRKDLKQRKDNLPKTPLRPLKVGRSYLNSISNKIGLGFSPSIELKRCKQHHTQKTWFFTINRNHYSREVNVCTFFRLSRVRSHKGLTVQ